MKTFTENTETSNLLQMTIQKIRKVVSLTELRQIKIRIFSVSDLEDGWNNNELGILMIEITNRKSTLLSAC